MIFRRSAQHPGSSPDPFAFLPADGELAQRIRRKDWSQTPLGVVEHWPPQLKSALAICLDSGFPMCVWWGEDLIQLYNDACIVSLRAKHPAALGVPARQSWGEIWSDIGPLADKVWKSGEAVFTRDFEVVAGRDETLDSGYFTFSCSPLRDEAGQVAGLLVIGLETTDKVQSEAALKESGQRLRAIIESAVEYAIVTLDGEGRITSWNPGAERVLGYTEDEAIGRPGEIFFTPEDCAAGVPAVEMSKARDYGRASDERWHMRKDGSRFWASGVMLPIEDHKRDRYLKIFRDETWKRHSTERLRLLTHELEHRIKNTMAVVQSIAMQTLRKSASLEQARDALESRLVALARTHDILNVGNWSGGDLGDAVENTLRPLLSDALSTRVHLQGSEIHLSSGALLGLSLALHELATNAMKYGALSNDSGHVDVGWEIVQGPPHCFRLRWVERGGPPVEPPKRRGFGSRMIEEGLAHEFDGRVELKFASEGLECTILAPLPDITGER